MILNPDAVATRWEPHIGPQTEALSRTEFEVLYGGARGGGKTDAGMAWMVEPEYIKNPRYRGLVIRKNAKDLVDWIERAKIFYAPLGARITGSPALIRFPSGASISLGHLRDAAAYTQYQGHEYQKILIEELTQIPDETRYEMILSSCRSTVPGLRPGFFGTANPGGAGHAWVKRRFVSRANKKAIQDPVTKLWRVFIPARVYDNPTLMRLDPTYVHRLEGLTDQRLRAAWLDGSWDVFSGQFFDMWHSGLHVIKPRRLPPQWTRYRGLDWGYTAPAACVWCAVDYMGNHYFYREYYKTKQAPADLARHILELTPDDEVIDRTLADPSIWAKNQYASASINSPIPTERSIEQLLVEAGLYCERANNDRVNGWQAIRDLMAWDLEKAVQPKFYVFDTCTHIIDTFPNLPCDTNNPEDIDTDSEDHLADALRYIVMHTTTTTRPIEEKTFRDQLVDKIIQKAQGNDQDLDQIVYNNDPWEA